MDHADIGQAVEHQLDPERGQQKTEYLLGDQHPARVQLAADLHRPAEDDHVEHQYRDEYANGDGDGAWDFGLAFLVDTSASGPVHNPHRMGYSAGGSSSGRPTPGMSTIPRSFAS